MADSARNTGLRQATKGELKKELEKRTMQFALKVIPSLLPFRLENPVT
jgi:hypothetical protein